MVYTLFFSRLSAGLDAEGLAAYSRRADALRRRAGEVFGDGFVDLKTFVADDGERLTVVRFRDPTSQARWKADPVHREAQREGRATFYDEYRIVVCEEVRERGWKRGDADAEGAA